MEEDVQDRIVAGPHLVMCTGESRHRIDLNKNTPH